VLGPGTAIEEAGQVLGVEVIRLVAREPADFDGAMSTALKARVDGLIVSGTPRLRRNARQLADLFTKHRLPAMGFWSFFAEDGFLMGYSPSMPDQFRRAAVYVDKILKGAKPADLPVEQPTKFELAISLKTAKALGLTISPSLLLRADRLIE
jgi:putative tryptophan/tyrosine transport system substrate-binding protein